MNFGKIAEIAMVCVCLSGAGHALAAAPALSHQFRGVIIDVDDIARQVGPAYADRIRALAQPIASQVFGDVLGHGGPMLVLRIHDISLSSPSDGKSGGSDNVSGAGLIVEGHRIVARYALRGAPQSTSTLWTQPDRDTQIRLHDDVDFLLRWLRRDMGI